MRITNLLLIPVILVFAGCACTSITKQNANGVTWKVQSNRLLWQTEQVKVSVKTNGAIEVTVNKTEPDSQSITATAGAIGVIVGTAVRAAGEMQ